MPEGAVTSVALGPDGRVAAGYSILFRGGGVVLWGSDGERQRPTPLLVEEGYVKSVAFGHCSRLAAGYSRDSELREGSVLLFDTDPSSWRQKAGRLANRNITRAKWKQFFSEFPYRRTIRSLPWPPDITEAERSQAEAVERRGP